MSTTQPENILSETDALPKVSERFKYAFLLGFATLLFAMAFVFNEPGEVWRGSVKILVSPAKLITDYFALTNIGATFLNASLMSFFNIGVMILLKARITGAMVAAVFTIAGFSLFGKNFYNSFPIVLGVILYCRISSLPYKKNLTPAFFGTALAPLVSEITFNLGFSLWIGIPLGIMTGTLVGLVLTPMSRHFLHFHQGYNLYNIGFTTGIIGTCFIALLRTFDVKVEAVSMVSGGHNLELALFLYSMFLAMLILGLWKNRWSFKGYRKILKESGKLSRDYIEVGGFGLALINMALLGFLSSTYVLLIGGELNGPTIGGIFTVVGFGAAGKHIKNVTPVLLGIFFMGILNVYDIGAAPALMAALFGTTLAPISGCYGPLAGMIAGALHMALVTNIGELHAGMNLYNNGFSGGFVAAALAPVFDWMIKLKKDHEAMTDTG